MLWIIYKDGIGFSKFIAERIQDILDEFIDVNVGSSRLIEPSYIVEENLEYLIIGDILSNEIPSLEIQNWLNNYQEISKTRKLTLKTISGFYVTFSQLNSGHSWEDFLRKFVKSENIYPQVLHFELKKEGIMLDNNALEMIKAYSNDLIKFINGEQKNV